ncbi:MAG: hypothetical protein A2Y76_10100 [Planctomycetes bacterium RBG_13_60_9]|nr:MAG: hypothetical protein A2Y76_10100 [Planctomycetes bacterium RBG_13_60_9]
MLGLSALVLARAVAVVRTTALRQATGLLMPDRPKARGRKAGTDSAAIKRVHGPPVVWKELRAPFIQGADNRNSYIGLGITVAALAFTYWGAASSGTLDEDFTHTSYIMLFVFIGVIVNIVFSATRITTERESQSWMLLLTTPLSDGEILFGKAVSAFRRCLPIWGLLAGHVILFTLVHYIHPVAILHLFMLVAWLTCFITGAGLYFSARFARTTSAVVASFALVVGLWMVGPILAGLAGAMHKQANLFAAYMWTHPMAQASLIMSGAAGVQNANAPWRSLNYSTGTVFRSSREFVDIGTATWILAAVAAVYIVAGLAFFWRAKRLVRREVF